MADVFLSYAREDRAAAHAIAQVLAARGWSVWWDREIVAGDEFDRAIERELARAGAVVVLWSKSSVTSEWVKNEAAEAAERGVLVPVLLDDAKLPLEFRRRQAADLGGWSGVPGHDGFEGLCRAIATKLPGAVRSPPVSIPTDDARVAPTRTVRYAVAAVVLLAGLAAALYWTGWRATGAGTPATSESRGELADLVAGTYMGDVVADSKGPSQSDVTVTIARLGPRRVRVSADYARLPPAEVELTRIGDQITSAAGSATLVLQAGHLDYSVAGEISYVGTKRP